ncbi:putative WD repeat-containing protein C26H5.03 [Verticillium dahliae VDG1]|nr:putative WD repeat-containing protein C26H5.03 [Verticillium dahliae VDG1]
MPDHKPPSAPRIAISFGKNSSSSSSSKPNRPPPPPPSRLGKRSRAPALGNDSDSDSDDGRAHRHEAITELGGDSDADRSSRKKPRDLKDMQWGLTVTKPRQQQAEEGEEGARTGDGGRDGGREQDSAYKDDVAQHVGADATMEDYDAIPDGEFGAALLRGMGWDGKMRGPKPSRAAAGERRQNQLGLGAKKLQDAEDLGQWNHGGAKKRDGRPPKLADYRREEERKKAERRDRREGGYRERDRYEDAARDRERDRDRGRDRDYDRDRGSHRDRDRERDSGRHRSVRKKTGILRC